MREGAKVRAIVDAARRAGIRRAHSATHILHYALQKNLGTHAQQQGSKVDDDWLRFDFTNLEPGHAREQLAAIDADVDERVAAAEPVKWETLPLAEARKQGAMMLFGEKYPDPVRMVSMGTFSKELCGGTHLTNTRRSRAVRDPERRRRVGRHAADHGAHGREGGRARASKIEAAARRGGEAAGRVAA